MLITDKTIIDFGKWKGKEYQDVPADWLMWYYGTVQPKQIKTEKEQAILFYIQDNWDVLKKELKERNPKKY